MPAIGWSATPPNESIVSPGLAAGAVVLRVPARARACARAAGLDAAATSPGRCTHSVRRPRRSRAGREARVERALDRVAVGRPRRGPRDRGRCARSPRRARPRPARRATRRRRACRRRAACRPPPRRLAVELAVQPERVEPGARWRRSSRSTSACRRESESRGEVERAPLAPAPVARAPVQRARRALGEDLPPGRERGQRLAADRVEQRSRSRPPAR